MRAESTYMIRAEGLTKRFPAHGKRRLETVAVEDLTLHVRRGEVFGFLGPNGAGKTTTVRMLCTLIAPTAGRAWVGGREVGREDGRIRASVGILTETPGLYGRLDAATNLSFFAKLYGVDKADRQIAKYLQMLGLWERRNELVGSFSRGMRQKLAIARALLHEPPLLFLDEPTSGLDPEAARVVRDFVAELRGEGRTIFLCTHNLDEADRLCDRIGVIKQRLISVDTPARLRQRLYGHGTLIRMRTVAPEILATVEALPFVHEARQVDEGMSIKLDDPPKNNPQVVRALVSAGADIQFVEEVSHSLESVYFDLIAQAREDEAT